MKKKVKSFLHLQLESISRKVGYPVDYCQSDIDTIEKVRTYTMSSISSLHAIIQAIKYISKNNIEGDIVECGVWRGGCIMAILDTLQKERQTNRKVHLYDTFEGMTPPASMDISIFGTNAQKAMTGRKRSETDRLWAYTPLDQVQNNINMINYPTDQIFYNKGPVEKTIPDAKLQQISFLRLDTDWFSSTHHELTHLFPLIAKGGVIVIDDYGHWEGARAAVKKYFTENKVQVFLNRLDYSARLGIIN